MQFRTAGQEPGARSPGPAIIHEVLGLVVLVADVLENLFTGGEVQESSHFPRPRVSAGIVDRDLDLHVPEIGTAVALDDVRFLRLRTAGQVLPHAVVETDGVDHQCVALPSAD